MENKYEQRVEIFDILRILACFLITNSHCRDIYPLFFFAIGGGHGNALFFVVSGFLLAKIKLPFIAWIKKRVRRIVPITLLFVLISMFLIDGIEMLQGMKITQIFFLYVNKYWFVAAIFIYYFIYYLVFKTFLLQIKWTATVYFIGYVLLYVFFVNKNIFSIELEGFSLIKVYFYFGIFLLGGILRWLLDKYEEIICEHIKIIRCGTIITILISFAIWAGEYALIMIFSKAYTFQFLIHLAVFMFSAAMLIFAYTFRQFRFPQNYTGKLLNSIASSTLEIYLVQVTVKQFVVTLMFPVNWIVFFGIAFGGGVLLHNLLNKVGIVKK